MAVIGEDTRACGADEMMVRDREGEGRKNTTPTSPARNGGEDEEDRCPSR